MFDKIKHYCKTIQFVLLLLLLLLLFVIVCVVTIRFKMVQSNHVSSIWRLSFLKLLSDWTQNASVRYSNVTPSLFVVYNDVRYCVQ
jgi:hypothetical protein